MLYFNSIIGHDKVKEHLQTAIEQKKISHSYIINGETGNGKKLIASVFAETLQCEDKGINPCGLCKSCLQSESKNHPDIIWVTHEKYSIGVDDIRNQIISIAFLAAEKIVGNQIDQEQYLEAVTKIIESGMNNE